jgi:hypothetical protein
MARSTPRPASSAKTPTHTNPLPPAPPGEADLVGRLEELKSRFDRAAFDHPRVDAVVVYRPDLRREEAEREARNLYVRPADPASENYGAELNEQMRGTHAAISCAIEWESWIPGEDKSIHQLGSKEYWPRVIKGNEYPEFPGPATCKSLWRCALLVPPDNDEALRRFNCSLRIPFASSSRAAKRRAKLSFRSG